VPTQPGFKPIKSQHALADQIRKLEISQEFLQPIFSPLPAKELLRYFPEDCFRINAESDFRTPSAVTLTPSL
jgi:hypothetical protein